MRILQVNKFLYPKGGAELYMLGLSHALEEKGHEVAFFGMDHPNNLDLPYRQYWVKGIDFKSLKGLEKIKAAPRLIWNRQAKKNFRQLIAEFKPDLIHCHNIYHQLTPSILPEAKRAGIPVVMHLHDYKLIAADYLMFHDGKPCLKCAGATLWHCVRHRCYGSLAASFLAALETWINRDLLDVYRRHADLFVSPSRFLQKTFIAAGYPEHKVRFVPNFAAPAPYIPAGHERDYLLYFGRLSREKGIDVLIRAVAGTSYRLKIAGNGPEEKNLKELAAKLKIEGQVEFVGFQAKESLDALIAEARAIILPSIWFENAPLALLEAIARGKICLTSNIGGLPEIIQPGNNGLLFKPDDENSLRQELEHLSRIDPDLMKHAAYQSAQQYTIQKVVPEILAIYQEVIGKRNK